MLSQKSFGVSLSWGFAFRAEGRREAERGQSESEQVMKWGNKRKGVGRLTVGIKKKRGIKWREVQTPPGNWTNELSSTLKKVLKSTERACTLFHHRMREFQANRLKKKKKKGLSHSLLPRGKNDLFFYPSFSPVTDSHRRISLASVSLVL